MNKLQLQLALTSAPPCCVVDARRPESRAKTPLEDAVPYVKGLKINPTASVVVVADSDRIVTGVANELARDYPGKRIIAVKGGASVWQAAAAAMAKSQGKAGGMAFVIPKNTCESGVPLQHLTSEKK